MMHELLGDVLSLHEALLSNALLLDLLELLHGGFLTLTLPFHLLLDHCTVRVAHFVDLSGQAEVGLIAKMRQKGRLLHRYQLLHLGLLQDLFEVNGVVALQTLLVLSFLSQRRQIVDLLFHGLCHSIKHLLSLASAATHSLILLVFLRLLFLHVLGTAA